MDYDMMDEIQKRTSPLRIFLCHSSGDKPEVRNLYQRLSSDGFDPWLDEENLLAGQDWELEIEEAVQTSDIVIVCLSHKAITKAGYVQKEINDALKVAEKQPEGTIFLIPLKLEECNVPKRLQRWHWINLFEEKGYGRLISSLRFRAGTITSGSNPKTNMIQRPEEKMETEISAYHTNSIGMKFTLIPAGKFMMGSEKFKWSRPVHSVKIQTSFYLGIYQVTQREWKAIMGNNPSEFNGNDLPVESISWNEVQDFIKKLNEKEGTNKHRLPTEAEWEYAARAGTTTRYSFGDDDSKLGEYAWYSENSGNKTHPVGKKKENRWGLYDVHGNVWKWVQDEWHDTYNGAQDDGSARENGIDTYRNRGGSWFNYAWNCRSASRNYDVPGYRYLDLGFRLLQEV
jgi:formylglycine-generating enzyme required for sulfatase activity